MRPWASPTSPSSPGVDDLDASDVAVGTKVVLPVMSSQQGSRPSGDAVVSLRLLLHRLEARVVVGKLVQMGQGDLAGRRGVVAGDVGLRVMSAVLELDVEAGPELLDIERR